MSYPYQYERCLDMDQGDSTQGRGEYLEGFTLLLSLTEACGAILIILVAVWTGYYRNGFSWRSNPQLEFNWHPLLMIIGLVFVYGNAMLFYRIRRNVRKRRLKLTHAGMMLFIVLLMVIALVAVFDSHNLNRPDPIPNMYSLHSWVGLTTVILFCCQWLAGCISFLFPGLQAPLRASYMPLHVYFGIAGFIGAIASCLLGLNEKAFFVLKNYSEFVPEGVLINFIGILLVVFGGLCVYLVTQEHYRRLPRPEDDVLLSG
ncbi:cytochrome b561 isoform X2 [Ooceraea biroi]|uniref:Cytochrome b561 n=1 Tax=Ooceraea biroi TaxID=2015173 RepID=A0A026WH26_OOCBI|nr:cytochrome b561 isoform X2 [Ooceraea biroi]EZA54976.1 Cytochrome b561 [Ooceraea biroi]